MVHLVYIVLHDFYLFRRLQLCQKTVWPLLSCRVAWIHPRSWLHTARAGMPWTSWSHRCSWWVVAVNWSIVNGLVGSLWDFGLCESFGYFLLCLILLLEFFGRILWLLAVESLRNFFVFLFNFFMFIFPHVIFAINTTFHPVLGLFLIQHDPSYTRQPIIIATISQRYLVTLEFSIPVQVRQSAWLDIWCVRFGYFATHNLLI